VTSEEQRHQVRRDRDEEADHHQARPRCAQTGDETRPRTQPHDADEDRETDRVEHPEGRLRDAAERRAHGAQPAEHEAHDQRTAAGRQAERKAADRDDQEADEAAEQNAQADEDDIGLARGPLDIAESRPGAFDILLCAGKPEQVTAVHDRLGGEGDLLSASDELQQDNAAPVLLRQLAKRVFREVLVGDDHVQHNQGEVEQLTVLKDATLLVNVSNDAWFGDSTAPHQHLQIARMRALGIHQGRDLERVPLEVLRKQFGKAGEHYFLIVRGIDERPVNPERIRKSWGAETTFQTDLSDLDEMHILLNALAERVLAQMSAQQVRASAVTVKVKYANFDQVTRSRTLGYPFNTVCDVIPHLGELLKRTEAGQRKVRLLGVSFSMLEEAGMKSKGQLDLFA